MKKIIVLIIGILIICVIGLVILNKMKNESNTNNVTVDESGVVTITNKDEQIEVIANNLSKWNKVLDFANDKVEYIITDLDHNGRLELIISQMGGTGSFSYNSIYEVSKDFKELEPCENNVEEGNSEVDFILSDYVEIYYDSEKQQYYYVLQDHMKTNPNEYYDGTYAFSLKNGKIQEDFIVSKITFYDYENNNEEIITYTDKADKDIEEADYMNAVTNYFDGCEEFGLELNWKDVVGIEELTHEELIEALNESVSL